MKKNSARLGNPPLNVCLFGASPDTGNLGVSALAVSLIKLISERNPQINISLFVGGKFSETRTLQISDMSIKVNIMNYRLSPRARINEHLLWIFLLAVIYRMIPLRNIRRAILNSNSRLSILAHADFIGDIFGGDSFSDIYGMRRLALGSMPSLIALLLGKKLVLLPQTYGPFKSKFARLLARVLLERADRILTRDFGSEKVIAALVKKARTVDFCPDVAFTLPVAKLKNIEIPWALSSRFKRPLIGLNINGLLYSGGYTRNNMFGLKSDYRILMLELAQGLLQDSKTRLLLIPHNFGIKGSVNNDLDACQGVFQSLRQSYGTRVHLVPDELDQHEVKAIIGKCDFFIGARMHACIAALSQAIPAVGIAYSDKFKGVFDSIGFGDLVVDARHLDASTAIATTIKHFQNRKQLRQKLKGKIAQVHIEIQDTFKNLLNQYQNTAYKTSRDSVPVASGQDAFYGSVHSC